MKYMGHKGKLLPILGQILLEESKNAEIIADPFCGSGAVSWFLATATSKKVYAGDLQSFAAVRAAAVVERTSSLDVEQTTNRWFSDAKTLLAPITSQFPNAENSIRPQISIAEVQLIAKRSRTFCENVLPRIIESEISFPVTLAYGGHYFSPMQALELDALRQTLPYEKKARQACLAALIEAASKCAASPGHTAQPFQPTATAALFIAEAWNRNVWNLVRQSLEAISGTFAKVEGSAVIADFKDCVTPLRAGDLVFADPPYSDVHYSRFYHVLETLARGVPVQVSGVGRYPPISERPSSHFSKKSQSGEAAKKLIDVCSEQRLNLVLTFPSAKASNGLSANDFVDLAKGKFSKITVEEVNSTFSTLGGNGNNRNGRIACPESIVCFRI
ncbi:DNA adenine methylase [uncultured Pseudacidovorax sp.]|uniref:DNA adenine methylase n=1 Tax=uncultured Pseudacidovorax sp. TaxID=679313 RepID=UPI0025D83E4F|nr:DNA adenine methylase [uncultured Pseudacidovorax sp.]